MIKPIYPDGTASKAFIISPKLKGVYYAVFCPINREIDGEIMEDATMIVHFHNDINDAKEHLTQCREFNGDDKCFMQKVTFTDMCKKKGKI